MLSFDHWTHCRLLKESSKLAQQYRVDCGLEKAEVVEAPVVKDVIEESKDYTRDDLKVLLTWSEIKFFNWAKTEKLLELCIENKLI